MILDGKQDETFLILYEQRLFVFLWLCLFFVELRGLIDDVFLTGDSGILLAATGTREVFLESRDREAAFFIESHF